MTGYDAIIIGGGIQGATMALEAARRGVRALVLERDAPGGGTTAQSFGIVHGGLRYLQHFDLARSIRSRCEQAWFLRTLPELVKPLACVMPLYRASRRSPALFRAAFLVERALARSVSPLPGGELLDTADVVTRFPIAREGLVGAARWHEAVLYDAQAATRRLLEHAEQSGAACLAGAEATGLIKHNDRVAAVCARTAEGAPLELRAPVVILCAGPASRTLAARFDRDYARLSSATLAFNVVLDAPAPDGVALAVSPQPGRGRSYFIRADERGLVAGTWYAPWTEGKGPYVSARLLESCLADLRACLPGLELTQKKIRAVLAGVLPDTDGSGRSLRNRDVFIDHGRHGGPRGLYSVLGTKLTTARALAEHATDRIWRASRTGERAAAGVALPGPSAR